ncbi:ATP synthase subunit I [Peptostreptococcus faecalis]|uniref:ATP synthase subunit I n=1 Tax=Peptostreptococcus faecalis TaxID=2045015 RepID=UPI0015E13130|nr:ATP synthase subunit I [Peptostreptococcus faecalis]
MDKELLKDLKKIYLGIVVYDIVALALLALAGKASLSTIGGVIAGSLISMLALFMLARDITSIVGKQKNKAVFAAVFGYGIRFAMYAAILIFAAVNKSINIYTVAVGLLSTSIVIRVQQLILSKVTKKLGKEE